MRSATTTDIEKEALTGSRDGSVTTMDFSARHNIKKSPDKRCLAAGAVTVAVTVTIVALGLTVFFQVTLLDLGPDRDLSARHSLVAKRYFQEAIKTYLLRIFRIKWVK